LCVIGRITHKSNEEMITLGDGERVSLFAEASEAWTVDFEGSREATVVVRRPFIETYARRELEQFVVDRAAELAAAGVASARL
jgi:hypothetical protein